MTRSATAEVTFARPFRLPEMDRDFPPGTYTVETDEEALDTMAALGYRRTATRIRLPRGGATEMLSISPTNLDAALAKDSANV